MSQLQSVMASGQAAERALAIRRLLATPLISASGEPELFVCVLRHREWLVSWFANHAGWKLAVEASGGIARLHKVPAARDATRPAQPAGRPEFDRRRYALLCLTLAACDEVGGQTTLANLARLVEELSREEPSLELFDPTTGAERRAFVDALRLLLELGVLRLRDGDADRYAQSREGDALFDVSERVLAQLIAAPVPPTFAGGPERLLDEAWPRTDEGQKLRFRHQAMRRLLDDPVLYFEDLAPDAAQWVDHSRGFLYALLEQDAGFTVERRAEGLCAIDPSGVTADTSFPDGGSTAKHAAILLAEQLTQRRRDGRTTAFTAEEAVQLVRKLHRDFGEPCHWSKQYPADDEGCRRLAFDALRLLEAFGLVERLAPTQDLAFGWRLRPAIARFRPGTPTRRPRPKSAPKLR
jgi:uncharacterized protein (TIGR02678 family)